MRALLFSTLLGLTVYSGAASARPHRHSHHAPARVVVRGPAPVVRVVIDPWGPAYRPGPRAGYAWVDGYYAPSGRFIPGYYAPVAARPGYQWVPGHWAGHDYVEGYWREPSRPGFTWVEGAYDDRGDWGEGYWAPVGRVDERGHVEATYHEYE